MSVASSAGDDAREARLHLLASVFVMAERQQKPFAAGIPSTCPFVHSCSAADGQANPGGMGLEGLGLS